MQLVQYPDPVLRRRSVPLVDIDEDVRGRIESMFEIMYHERGVGLAAPQVAWSVRIFVVNALGEEQPEGEQVYVNPVVLESYGEEIQEEGCLSIPEVRGRVTRAVQLVVEAQDVEGRVFRRELEGLGARIFQHELDHLDGILFINRLGPAERLLVNRQLKKLEKEHRKRTASRR